MGRTKKSVLMPLVLLAGWLLWTTVNILAAALKSPMMLQWALSTQPVYAGYAFLSCGLVFMIYDRIQPRPGFAGFAVLVPLICYVAAIWTELLTGFTRTALGWATTWAPGYAVLFLVVGLREGLFFVLFSMMYFLIDHWLQLGEQREKARAAEAAAQQAQLQMLRYQINPHFLFNALNTIRAMILENPLRAREITTELSEFLRYSLDGCGTESTVDAELAAIENYLAIQRIRFERKLEVTVTADAAARACTVPCFLIHPLVENAVKYGMDTSPMPLRLEIGVAHQAGDLIVRVSNTGRLVRSPESHGTGTGLRNVGQRLSLIFPGRHTLSLVERNGWVHAEIRVNAPLPAAAPAS